MKHQNGRDPRVTRANGMVSQSRQVLLEALEAMGAEGGTLDELVALIGEEMPGENPKISIGRTIRNMESDGHVMEWRGRWYEKGCAPIKSEVRPLPDVKTADQPKVPVAVYANKRDGKIVSIYRTPFVVTDAIALAFLINEQWYKMPLFGSVRICIGPGDPPLWSADQEMYRNVVKIRITHKGGTVTEEPTSPSDIITIAPEE